MSIETTTGNEVKVAKRYSYHSVKPICSVLSSDSRVTGVLSETRYQSGIHKKPYSSQRATCTTIATGKGSEFRPLNLWTYQVKKNILGGVDTSVVMLSILI